MSVAPLTVLCILFTGMTNIRLKDLSVASDLSKARFISGNAKRKMVTSLFYDEERVCTFVVLCFNL